jgi:SNF2 family DNA or RNA helicase
MIEKLWTDFEYQPHQVEGIQWMLHREEQTPSGGLLCDEMGLGKTIQVLGLMKTSPKPMTLLVGPLAVLGQWEEAANRSGFQVWKTHPSKCDWQVPDNFDPETPSLYLINYERARHRPSLVNETVWDRLVLDEAHRVGNHKTQSFQSIQKIEANTKWLLTATPITNNIQNALTLYSILGVQTKAKTMDALKALAADTVLCRKMNDLRDIIPSLPSSPDCVKHSLDFDTDEEAEFYRGIQGVIQRRWKMLEQEAGGQGERFRLIMRLRQISIHPQVYIAARKRAWRNYEREDFLEPSTKFHKLQELIEAEAGENHRWLVFCHFHDEMELLQDHLSDCIVVRECGMYSGALSQGEREAVIQKSKEPLYGVQQEVLLVQLMSGGVGLNLQHFDRVVFMGPWWTAAIMDQAIGRAVRIGQEKHVVVHHLILKEEETMNIDKTMLEKAESKRHLCNEFLGGKA